MQELLAVVQELAGLLPSTVEGINKALALIEQKNAEIAAMKQAEVTEDEQEAAATASLRQLADALKSAQEQLASTLPSEAAPEPSAPSA